MARHHNDLMMKIRAPEILQFPAEIRGLPRLDQETGCALRQFAKLLHPLVVLEVRANGSSRSEVVLRIAEREKRAYLTRDRTTQILVERQRNVHLLAAESRLL